MSPDDHVATEPNLRDNLVDLATKAAASLGTAAGFLGFVALTGGAITWVRFSAAELPADQALAAFPRQELIVVGAAALAAFFVLGIVALAAVYALDGGGRPTDGMRQGLMVLVSIEALVAVGLDMDPPVANRVLAALLILVLAVGGMVAAHFPRHLVEKAQGHRLLHVVCRVLAALSKEVTLAPTPGELRRLARRARLQGELAEAWAAVAAAQKALAQAKDEEQSTARQALASADALVAAAEAAVGAPGPAKPTTARQLSGWGLAVQSVAVIVAAWLLSLLVDSWVALALILAAFLGTVCLGISRATGSRFWPYGIAVFFSVPLFGAAINVIRTYQSPKVQPAALIRRGDLPGQGVEGLYVTENHDRIYLASVTRECRGGRGPGTDQAQATTGHVFWVPKDQTLAVSFGTAQGIASAEVRAGELLDELVAARVPEVAPPGGGGGGRAAGPRAPAPTRATPLIPAIKDPCTPASG